MPTRRATATNRIVVFVEENKSVDFLFPSLAEWGADVRAFLPLLTAAPPFDQPHDRSAWVHYSMGDYPAVRLSVDDTVLVPFYSWLAKTYTFADHHFGTGSNSTSGHLLVLTGQTPTFRNPPSRDTPPRWNLPTVLGLAERAGISWAVFTNQYGYPANLVTELAAGPLSANVHGPAAFVSMARAGTLPRLCLVWGPAGSDEHPPDSQPADPKYLQKGHDRVWRAVDAVVKAGWWADTTFVLTWDDWGGYADHVVTPCIETLPDALHPNGYQAIGGSRVPLIVFGGRVRQGIDSRWHSHASISKTVIDLLGLPPLGVPRVDRAPSLASRISAALDRPVPPAFGSTIVQPSTPSPRPRRRPPAPWRGTLNQPMPPLVTVDGSALAPPTDGVVRKKPPTPPVY